MNTNNAVLIVLIIGLAIIGVLIFSKSNNTNLARLSSPSPVITPVNQETAVPTQKVTGPIKINLTSTNNDFNQTGIATLTEKNGKVAVALSITPIPTLKSQPAHIHTGACPNPSGIVYPLNNVINGKSVTTINTTLQKLFNQLPLAINVHESNSQINIYTACGDLEK